MNTSFKGVTTALALSATLLSPFFAQNVQAAPSDAVCVSMGKLGGTVIHLKKLGISEQESITTNTKRFKGHRLTGNVVKMIRYIYVDDSAYVDAKYLYLKCGAGHFD